LVLDSDTAPKIVSDLRPARDKIGAGGVEWIAQQSHRTGMGGKQQEGQGSGGEAQEWIGA
jgi:hypothetical protein